MQKTVYWDLINSNMNKRGVQEKRRREGKTRFTLWMIMCVARFGDQGRKDEEVRGDEPKKGV